MPETAVTHFPAESLARLREQHESLQVKEDSPLKATVESAIEIIDHLETDIEALRATIGNIRLRVTDALKSP